MNYLKYSIREEIIGEQCSRLLLMGDFGDMSVDTDRQNRIDIDIHMV